MNRKDHKILSKALKFKKLYKKGKISFQENSILELIKKDNVPLMKVMIIIMNKCQS